MHGRVPHIFVRSVIKGRRRDASVSFPHLPFERDHVVSEHPGETVSMIVRLDVARESSDALQNLIRRFDEIASQAQARSEARQVTGPHIGRTIEPWLDYDGVQRIVFVH